MDASIIYAIVVGGSLSLFLLRSLIIALSSLTNSTAFKKCKTWLDTELLRRRRFTPPVSLLNVILQSLYWVGTAVFNVVGVSSVTDASARAGSVAVFNLTALLFGDKLAFAADLVALSRQTYVKIHKSIGVMTVVQMVVRFLLEYSAQGWHFHNLRNKFDLISVCSIVLLFLLALPFPRNYFFEFFLNTHYLLAAITIYCLWRASNPGLCRERIAILVALGLHASLVVVRLGKMLYRNLVWGKWFATTQVVRYSGGVELLVDVTRPFKVNPGQFFYVSVPGASFGSWFQRHPFSVAWWTEDENGLATSVSFFIKPQGGFTSSLLKPTLSDRRLLVGLDGPYGRSISTSAYGTLILFATGIGIAAQMPLVKRAIAEHKSCRTAVRQIYLLWQLDHEYEEDWATELLGKLLSVDAVDTKVFQASIYVTGTLKNPSTHDRPVKHVPKYYDRPDLNYIVEEKLASSVGRTLIAVSAKAEFRDEIKRLTREHVSDRVDFEELDFQPSESRRVWSFTSPQVKYRNAI